MNASETKKLSRLNCRLYFAIGDGLLSAILLFGIVSVIVIIAAMSLHQVGFLATVMIPTVIGSLFFGFRRYLTSETNHDPK